MTEPKATTTSSEPDAKSLLALARSTAEEVGARLAASLDGDARASAITSKSTGTDLVTEMDTWAEGYISEQILAARPSDGIVGEEGADVVGTSGVTWCVDPIDGTVNFVHGLPGFCVSIAAQVDGRSVAAVVVSPLHGDTFTATLHGGAFRNDRAIRCSEPPGLERAVIGTGFGYRPERRRRQAEVVTKVIPHIADIRRFGAAALDLCWVACGRLDGYWEVGLNSWDHAAGALVASEAGALCGGPRGEAPSESFVLAAPPSIWPALRDLLLDSEALDV